MRGVVATKLGYNYTGIDLCKEQIEENKKQAQEMGVEPAWINGDSEEELKNINTKFDFIFSCPPYLDLEVYSDNPNDLSNMDHGAFFKKYESIIKQSLDKLKNNAFACFVISEVRDKKSGFFIGFVPKTIEIFERAGAHFYNEIILVNTAGTLPLRAGKYFRSSRKVGRTHQNILVFVKGDPKEATKKIGDVYIDESLITDGEQL